MSSLSLRDRECEFRDEIAAFIRSTRLFVKTPDYFPEEKNFQTLKEEQEIESKLAEEQPDYGGHPQERQVPQALQWSGKVCSTRLAELAWF